MAAKYRRLAAKALPSDMVARIENIVWDLDKASSVGELIRCLAANDLTRSVRDE
jgi:hypothetical protein